MNKQIEKLQQAILNTEFAKDNDLDLSSKIDSEGIEEITLELENNNVINFSFEIRSNSSGDDYWMQSEYWSKKLNKTIIFDYDTPESFDTIQDMALYLSVEQEEINKFESKIHFH